MSEAPSDTRPATNRATRVGIIFAPLGKLNVAALKYLIVHLNTLQHSIEFEILAADLSDPLLALLRPGKLVDRSDCRKILPEFHARILMQFAKEQSDYDLVDQSLPEHFVVISLARFSDEHYGLKDKDIHIQALGNWKRQMAPPSIFEFIITLLMRQSASFLAPSVSKSVHLGTKGCLFDFTANLGEARYKSLQSFICTECRIRIEGDGAFLLADDLVSVLDTKWLGAMDDPCSPACIVSKLGYDLFLTKGIKPSFSENIRALLREELTKEILKLVGGILLAFLLLKFGLTKESHSEQPHKETSPKSPQLLLPR